MHAFSTPALERSRMSACTTSLPVYVLKHARPRSMPPLRGQLQARAFVPEFNHLTRGHRARSCCELTASSQALDERSHTGVAFARCAGKDRDVAIRTGPPPGRPNCPITRLATVSAASSCHCSRSWRDTGSSARGGDAQCWSFHVRQEARARLLTVPELAARLRIGRSS